MDTYTSRIPEPAKDVRLNLGSVAGAAEPLTAEQRFTVLLAAAHTVQDGALVAALRERARADLGERAAAADADAVAAAALMAMNNVFYRTRHMLGGAYEAKAPRLRMNRMMAPATDGATFELAALAVSAINGCQVCVQAHEQSVRKHGLTDEHVVQAVRLAAVVASAAVAVASTAA